MFQLKLALSETAESVILAAWCFRGRTVARCALIVCGVHGRPYLLAAMRDCSQASIEALSHAVQFSESLIGFGNFPALTQDQIEDPETPSRCFRVWSL